jgi:hypothetical protein
LFLKESDHVPCFWFFFWGFGQQQTKKKIEVGTPKSQQRKERTRERSYYFRTQRKGKQTWSLGIFSARKKFSSKKKKFPSFCIGSIREG